MALRRPDLALNWLRSGGNLALAAGTYTAASAVTYAFLRPNVIKLDDKLKRLICAPLPPARLCSITMSEVTSARSIARRTAEA